MQTKEEKKKRNAEYHQRVMAEKRKKKDKLREERISRSLLDNTDYWHKIPGYGDKYRINTRGNIFRTTDMKFVIPCLNDTGYWRINLNKKGKILQHYLHRIMCEVFIGLLNKGDTVAFKDKNEKNCRLSNLVLVEKGSGVYHTRRTTREAEEGILSNGKLKSIVLWLSHDGEYHDQRTPFVAKCFNNHTIIGNYWDWGGKRPASGCKYCSNNIPQTHYEAESVLYDSGIVKDVLYFHTYSGRYTNSRNKVTYLCFNDHLNTKIFGDQRYNRRGCRYCGHRFWLKDSLDNRFSDNSIACSLYICKFRGDKEVFYKVGISRQGAEKRFKQENLKNYSVEIKAEFILGSLDAYTVEQQILSHIYALDWRHKPRYTFGGSSECFKKHLYLDIYGVMEDMVVKKLFGEDNPSNKLSVEAVRFIKTNCEPGDSIKGIKNFSRMFRVHPKTVYNIVNDKTWKDVIPYYDFRSNT